MWSPDQILFPTDSVPRAGPLPRHAQALELRTPDGEVLRGTHFAGSSGGKERTLVLGFGGNGWNGQHVAEYLHDIFPDADVIAFHYRGYRPSTGRPSARALLADAPLVHDFAVDRVEPDRTVAVGFSIGTGVASALASEREIDGAILVTPFESLKAVAQNLVPWLPIGPFFAHEMDSASYLKRSDVPVAIIAAERDDLVRPERTSALRPQVRNLVFDRTIARAGHNDIYQRTAFKQAMRDALKAIASADSRS